MSRSDGSTADYYVLPEGATQLQDLISHRDMNSQIGEIFRACYRYGIVSHSDKMRDAKKIRFYAQAEVERLEKLSLAEDLSHSISDNTDWSVAPEYAQWLAQDKDGTWHWFDSKPFTLEFAWDFSSTRYDVAFKTGAISSNWKNTLQSRPASSVR
jgi:hypothetical protein